MGRTGWGAIAFGLALVAAGALAVWPPLVVMGGAMVIVTLACLWYVFITPNLYIERAVEPPRVEKGKPAIAVVRATNRSRRSLAPMVIEQTLGGTTFRAELPRLQRAQSGVRTYRLPTSQRGTYDVGPVEVPKDDPFGLCRRVRRMGAPQTISVHPRLLPLRPLPTGKSRNLEGPSSDMSPQGTVTFHRLREYATGDDLRMVHWPSTARTGKLVVRQYVDTAQPYTVVLVDLKADVYAPATFEEAMDVCASVVSSMSGGLAPVQLRTTAGQRIGGPAQRGPSALVDFLTDLAPSAQGDLAQQLLALRRDRGGSALVVVTGAVDLASLTGLGGLRRRFDHVILVSVVPGPPPAISLPGITVLSGATADEIARAWDAQVAR